MKSSGWYSSPVSGFSASSTWAYSLYVIASAASIEPSSSPSMLNCCCTRVTSVAGSRPAWLRAAKISNSLPKPQLPMFLPLKSSAVVMPLSAKDSCRVPDRWKIWAMLTMFAPASRVARALGTQAMAKSTWPSASTLLGHDVDAAFDELTLRQYFSRARCRAPPGSRRTGPG